MASSAVVVVDRRYCDPDQAVELKIVKKGYSASGGDYKVRDGHGNLVFKVEGVFWSRRAERIVYDVGGNPLFSMRRKMVKKDTLKSVLLGRNTFGITVHQNVDQAFIIALIIILYEIKNPAKMPSS